MVVTETGAFRGLVHILRGFDTKNAGFTVGPGKSTRCGRRPRQQSAPGYVLVAVGRKLKTPDIGEFSESTAVDPVVLEVRTRFIAEFPMRCDAAVHLIQGCANIETGAKAAAALRALAHRMAGLAGIIGFRRVSALASDLEEVALHLAAGSVDADAALAVVDSIRGAFAHELADPGPSLSIPAEGCNRGEVLVAEDDQDQRAVLLRLLADAGYRTRDVASGDLVVTAARAAPPSIVLLDVEMPGLDGYAVCRALKADPSLATVPVVFMTSHARVDERLVGLALGADDYLIKPIDPAELILRLERVRLRHVARAEQAVQEGVLPYQDFVPVARNRLARTPASLVLMRIPADSMNRALMSIQQEIRRADLAASLDRSHLLLLLSDLTASAARARTIELITRLGNCGIGDVAAGVSCAPRAGCSSVEMLMSQADDALVQARYCGRTVTVYGDAAERSTPPRGVTAVIADDDPDVTRIVDAQLRGAGYHTTVVFDGIEALAAIENTRPDLLVLDLMMPGLSGFDLLRRLNERDGSRPKVVVLSARGREEAVTRAFELGADDYVVKPFNPQELLVRIARLVR